MCGCAGIELKLSPVIITMPHYKASRISKNHKRLKTKKSGGNENRKKEPAKVTPQVGFVFDHKSVYGTLNFGFIHLHAMTLHHYGLDLNMIAYINYVERIFYDQAYNEKNLQIIMKKYDIPENHPNYIEFTTSKTLLVGETTEGEPVFLAENGWFYTVDYTTMLPNYTTRPMKSAADPADDMNPILPDSIFSQVYEFVPENEYVIPGVQKLIGNTVSNIKNGKVPQIHEIFNDTDFQETTNQKDAQYDLYRLGLTDDQKNVLAQHHFNYQIIKDLNYDLSLDPNNPEKYKYRHNERLGFFEFERMKRPFQKYRSNAPTRFFANLFGSDKYDGDSRLANDAFKRSLLVGFAGPYEQDTYKKDGEDCEVWRPVYLTPNGWFNDGTAIYSPDYHSIAITAKMMVDNGMADIINNKPHSFLTGKMAYCFSYGGNTMSSINFNRQHNFYIMDSLSRTGTIATGAYRIILYTMTFFISGIFALIPTAIWYLGPITTKMFGGKKTRKRKHKLNTRKKRRLLYKCTKMMNKLPIKNS